MTPTEAACVFSFNRTKAPQEYTFWGLWTAFRLKALKAVCTSWKMCPSIDALCHIMLCLQLLQVLVLACSAAVSLPASQLPWWMGLCLFDHLSELVVWNECRADPRWISSAVSLQSDSAGKTLRKGLYCPFFPFLDLCLSFNRFLDSFFCLSGTPVVPFSFFHFMFILYAVILTLCECWLTYTAVAIPGVPQHEHNYESQWCWRGASI